MSTNIEFANKQEMLKRINELCDGEEGRPKNVQDLATRFGWGENTVYSWKTSNPSVNRVWIVAKELGESLDYIVDGTIEEK